MKRNNIALAIVSVAALGGVLWVAQAPAGATNGPLCPSYSEARTSAYLFYETGSGESYASVARKVYGDSGFSCATVLRHANNGHRAIGQTLPSGLVLRVPVRPVSGW